MNPEAQKHILDWLRHTADAIESGKVEATTLSVEYLYPEPETLSTLGGPCHLEPYGAKYCLTLIEPTAIKSQ